ncbi:MAG: N-acetylmuramoyl-L-alanine amidase [Allobaculum sp.]
MVDPNTQPLKKRPRKKKRRLRKPIRIFLWCAGVGMTLSVGNHIVNAMHTDDEHSSIIAMLDTNKTDSSRSNQQQANGFIKDEAKETDPEINSDEVTDDNPVDEQTVSDGDQAAYGDDETTNQTIEVENESAEVTEPIATILVDAGHGGIDPGMTLYDENGNAVWYEKDINLNAAKKFQEAMAWINPEIRVVLVRDEDTSTTGDNFDTYTEVDELTNRTNMIAATGADYYLSLHCNSGGASQSGVELYVRSNDSFSNALASDVLQAFGAIGWSDYQTVLTTDSHPLHVVDLAGVPSMLVEMGYMTNPNDLAQLVDDQQLTTLMEQLAAAYSEMILSQN